MRRSVAGWMLCVGMIAAYGGLAAVAYSNDSGGAASQGEARPASVEELKKQFAALYAQQRYAEAIPVGEHLVKTLEAAGPASGPALPVALGDLAQVYHKSGRHQEAKAAFQRGLEIIRRLGQTESVLAGSFNDVIARMHLELGELDDAARASAAALAVLDRDRTAKDPRLASALATRGGIRARRRETSDAIADYQRAHDLLLSAFGTEDQRVKRISAEIAFLAEDARRSTPPEFVDGNARPPTKVKHVSPVYPKIAQAARVQGAVVLNVTISPTGDVVETQILKSIPLLDQAAIDAVRQWKFTSTIAGGAPVPVIMDVTVTFTLPPR